MLFRKKRSSLNKEKVFTSKGWSDVLGNSLCTSKKCLHLVFLQQRRKHILLHASKAACLLFLTIQENVIQWKQKGTKIIQKVYGNCDKFILVQKLWNPCPHFLMVFKRFLTTEFQFFCTKINNFFYFICPQTFDTPLHLCPSERMRLHKCLRLKLIQKRTLLL